ncbi:RusA family crossover junction endodeoxyribonuclease [Prescottella equi]|uniref:RusA family crossover junction endodeoxyribonuclease n=1 Tax=Rhodococcus hoagii TaxID=43767 RepID=UPI001EEC952A|nr:RusA family crossover junction endodeoxyribonuclease [Prescottella equi]
MTEIAFFVAGRPAPQGSKEFKGKSRAGKAILVESSKHVGSWRDQIAWYARQQNPELLTGPVKMTLQFVMVRPKALSKSKPTPPATQRTGDSDKLARAVGDSLTGICYEDDAQIIELHVYKRIAEPDEPSGVHITIQETA